jgi:transcriptional regulator with GAF, ATPase, and Fis domain
MKKPSVLFTWLGRTDLKALEESENLGPIHSLVIEKSFDEIVILSSLDQKKSEEYLVWLRSCVSSKISLQSLKAVCFAPNDYEIVYDNARSAVERYKKVKGNRDTRLFFYVTPGTPTMGMIWIILANMVFPAELMEGSQEEGIKNLKFPFSIAVDYIPAAIRHKDESLIDLMEYKSPSHPAFDRIIGNSQSLLAAKTLAQRVAVRKDIPVLLLGESGTGKEEFARAIHTSSGRKGAPVVVNCGAIPGNLFESELFGHVKGSFSGATENHEGRIMEADGGTLFLDEIGELPLEMQAKLLRVLQEKTLRPVGGKIDKKSDFRLICATNRDLMSEVINGNFREDLFYRISVGVISLPPLRERGNDSLLLAESFLVMINRIAIDQPGYIPKKLDGSAREAIRSQRWRGNVRELYNTMLRVSVWSSGAIIGSEEINTSVIGMSNNVSENVLERSIGGDFNLDRLLDEVKYHYLKRALEESRGNKAEAARLLGTSGPQNIINWISKLGFEETKR